jgi:DNA-binding transcriptional LysR family regulator
MLPNATDLKNFIEAAAAGNITRAAQRLGMTQPTLSLSIQKLERTIGAPLLIRSKNGVHLTRAGTRVFARSRELLEVWERVQADAHEEQEEIQGLFSIGCHPSVAQYTLPHFLPKLLAEQKRLRFRLVHDLSRGILDLVVNREIDLGLVVNPVRHPDLVLRPLCKDSFSLWHSPSRRCSDALLCDPALNQVQWLLPRLTKQGVTYSQIIESSSLEVISSLAVAGAGYALLPDRVALLRKKEGLAKVDAKLPEYTDQVFLAYRVDCMNSAAGKFLTKVVPTFW